jgi:hypothetical protein
MEKEAFSLVERLTTPTNSNICLVEQKVGFLGIQNSQILLKGTVSRDFARFSTSGFFHESVSPKHLSVPLWPFRIFSKICGDIRGSRCTTGVNDTGGKWKKSSNIKILIILFGHLWC